MKKSEVDRILGRETDGAAGASPRPTGKSALPRVGATALEVLFGAPHKGTIKSLEGMYDATAGLVGAIGGIFNEDFKDNVGEHIAFDATDWLSKSIGYDKIEELSYLNDGKVGNFVRDAETAIGGMVPSIALSAIPYAGAVLGPVSMGMAAGGNNMEAALNKGAGYYGSWAYGIGTGLVESATEAIGGFKIGKGGTLASKILAGTKLGKFASSAIGKVAEGFISEGVEEVLADVADPALQYVTGVDKNIGENYKETAKGLPRTFLLGGTVGTIMGGGSAAVSGVRNSSRGGFKATRADTALEYISEVSKNYGNDVNKNARYDKAINGALMDISRELTSMNESQRKEYLKTMGVFKNAFNEDGSIKQDLDKADYNEEAVSRRVKPIVSLYEGKHAPIRSSVEVSDGASQAKTHIERALGSRASVVITNDDIGTEAYFDPDSNAFYINNDSATLKSAEDAIKKAALRTSIHEMAHSAEGTKEYLKLQKEAFRIAKDERAPAHVKESINRAMERIRKIGTDYADQLKNMDKAQAYYTRSTEATSMMLGELLGEQYVIDTLAERNESLVKQLINRFKGTIKKSATVDSESVKYLRKLVNRFEKALDNAHGGVKISQIGAGDEEQAESGEVKNVRFSKMNNESLESNVDNVLEMSDEEALKNKQEGNFISIMKHTPGVILQNVIEAENHEVIMRFDAFYLAVRKDGILEGHYHNMGEFMKDLPQRLSEPLAILKMDNGRINIFAEFTSEKNKNGIASVELNTVKDINSKNQKYNLVVSVFNAKDNYIKNNISKHGVSIEYKKEDLTQVNPQLYKWLATINDKSSNNIISENSKKSNTFDKKIDDERKSISKSVDREYLSAVENGDMEAAQRMVDEAAKRAGYSVKAYHGTPDVRVEDEWGQKKKNSRFTIFDTSKSYSERVEGEAHYFTNNENLAKYYAPDVTERDFNRNREPNIFSTYLKLGKSLVINGNGVSWRKIPIPIEMPRRKTRGIDGNIYQHDYAQTSFFTKYAKQNGYDSIVFKDIIDGDEGRLDFRGDVYAVFDSKRIKSADAVTYDENGDVIPLSARFNNENMDIRYSKSKREEFPPARHTKMIQAEELVRGYDEGTLTDAEALKRLNILGFVTGISKDNALEMLEELMPDIRDFATSERAAYRESNKKDTSSVAKATPSPQGEGYKGAEDEENFRNLVENDPNEIKHRAAEQERKESEESLLNEGGKVRETTTEFDEPEMSNEERRLMASAERVASGKDFFPRHAEMRPSNDESWDYWLSEVDRREGSVRKLKNGKIKVGMAQTANEVKLTKFINNKIMDKAYSNENVKSVIDKILSNSDIWGADESGTYMAKLKGKDLINAKKRLWAALNTAPEGERIGPALDIADFIVTHGMIEETVEITEDVINAQYIIDTLEPYKRKIDISHIKGDIEAVFDTDRSPFGLWAQKKSDTSRPFTADEVGQALEDAGIMLGGERGKLINEADIFIAMHKLYTEAQAIIKAATPTKNDIIGAYDAKEAHEIKQKIAREILRSYDEYGKETSFARLEKKFRGEIASLKKRVSEVYELNRAKNETLYLAGKFQDKKKGKFHNATQAHNKALNGIISVLSKLKYRSDINKSSSRALLDELAKWYTEDNPLLAGGAINGKTLEHMGFYSPYIKELIDYFRLDGENGGQASSVPTIEIKKDSELAKRIESADKSKYKVIQEYLAEVFYGQELTLSDGRTAIMDKRDINKLSYNANKAKIAQLGNIKDIIEQAVFNHTAENVSHDKFSKFHYYEVSVKYGEETYDLWLNVGVAKNDGVNHIYAITNKNEEAPTNYGVVRPVGNALQNASSDNSITESGEKVNINAKNNAELSLDELHAINKILTHMNFVVENFGKIWRRGKWIDAKDVGTKQLEIFNSAVQNQTVITRLIGNKFTDFFMDPEVIFSRLDGGDREGFFLSALWDMREADIKQRYLEMLALRELDEFEKNNKKYIKDFMSDKTTLTVGAKIDLRAEGGPTAEPLKIPKYAAVDLYLVSKTGNAIDTFEETGWFLKLDGKKSEKQQATITREHIKELEKQFTEKDWELIKILEKQYNGNLRQLKFETDMIRLGMSNVFDGYYYPINRRGASDLDSNDFFFMMERVGNSPFNNSRVRGAKNAIIVSNALTKFKRHVNGVTRYASYAVPIENINKILNVDVGNNANMPTSMQTALKTNDFARGAEDYLKKLIADAQQVNIKSDDATKFVSQLRGRYAKYQLGLSPKVILTQASSLIAGFGELRISSLAWAVAHFPKAFDKAVEAELDKYCPWAAVRHYEKGATRAMTVTDKVDKVGDFFTRGIEFTDRKIVMLEFLACQKEAQARFGLKIGTEENKIKAGELLTELGLKTQQNQLTTEKSAAMRSESEFAKTLTMFKADSMKQVSRWLQAVSTASVLRRKMQAAKQAGDMATHNALEAEYKKSVKTICKYSSVIVVSSIYMVMLARLFNKFYGRDEEDDENKILGFFKDIFGNICGMIPIVSELYSFFFEGYDTGSFMYDSINNVLSASKGVVDTCVSLVGGENVSKEKINSSIRDVIYALGISTGIPTKNAYKVAKGILDLIAPNAGDKVDAWFKAPSQSELEDKLTEGIKKGDERAVKSALDLLYEKYDLELKDAVLRGEYDRLMTIELTKGEDDKVKYTPLEAKIPSNLEIDGEDVELTRKDVNTFKNALISCESAQARVVKTANYKRLGNEERAYALRKINQYYFESTKYNYTGEKSSFAYYAKLVGVEQLALIMAYAKNLKGDEADSRFKKAQTRREKIEAYIKALGLNSVKTSLALRALGYGDKENDALVTSYVGRASALTKEERAEMLEILG